MKSSVDYLQKESKRECSIDVYAVLPDVSLCLLRFRKCIYERNQMFLKYGVLADVSVYLQTKSIFLRI